MNRTLLNSKYMFFFFLWVASSVVTTFGKSKPEDSLKVTERQDRILRPSEIADRNKKAKEDQKALEAYEKRNAEITPWVEDGSRPNPANAALLYYEALLLFPEPNSAIRKMLFEVSVEHKPDRQLKIYMGQCLQAIELTEIASRMQDCIWSALPERKLHTDAFTSRMDCLHEILMYDARILAAEGHYRVALERCLTLLRLARHFSKESGSRNRFFRNIFGDFRTIILIEEILYMMPPDADTLTWLRGQLAVVAQGSPPLLTKWLQESIRSMLRGIRTDPNRVAWLRNMLAGAAVYEQADGKIRNLTDEQIISLTGKELQRIMDAIFRIVDSEMDFEQKLTEMRRLFNNPKETDLVGPATIAILSLYNIDLIDFKREIDIRYQKQVSYQACVNGIKAAVEIYLIVAKTGKLPEKLPDYLPKDPFTGQDFLYEITDEGFTLRCQFCDQENILRYLLEGHKFRVQFKSK